MRRRVSHLALCLQAPHSINILTAIATHASATYGDKRSPVSCFSIYARCVAVTRRTYPCRHPEQPKEPAKLGQCRACRTRSNTHPSLFRSINLGMIPRTYVHVQMTSNMTRRRDWKLKRADWERTSRSRPSLRCCYFPRTITDPSWVRRGPSYQEGELRRSTTKEEQWTTDSGR